MVGDETCTPIIEMVNSGGNLHSGSRSKSLALSAVDFGAGDAIHSPMGFAAMSADETCTPMIEVVGAGGILHSGSRAKSLMSGAAWIGASSFGATAEAAVALVTLVATLMVVKLAIVIADFNGSALVSRALERSTV